MFRNYFDTNLKFTGDYYPQSHHILIVDQDPENGALIRGFLKKEKHNAFLCHDNAEAMKQFMNNNLQMVFMSVEMAVSNDDSLLYQLKKNFRTLPCVVFSPLEKKDMALKAVYEGALLFLIQPLRREEVAWAVGSCAEKIYNARIIKEMGILLESAHNIVTNRLMEFGDSLPPALVRKPETAEELKSFVKFLSRKKEKLLSGTLSQMELTQRETEVAIFVLAGKRNEVIARELDISIHTFNTHLKYVYSKLKVHSKAELILRLYKLV